MTLSGSFSSGATSHRQSSGTTTPRPSLGTTCCRARDKRNILQTFLNNFDSSLLQAVQCQTTYLESSWSGTYRHWKRNNLLQKYSFAAMSSIIYGESSDPQHREFPDIIQRLRQMIPTFDSLVYILTVTKSELT